MDSIQKSYYKKNNTRDFDFRIQRIPQKVKKETNLLPIPKGGFFK